MFQNFPPIEQRLTIERILRGVSSINPDRCIIPRVHRVSLDHVIRAAEYIFKVRLQIHPRWPRSKIHSSRCVQGQRVIDGRTFRSNVQRDLSNEN